MKIFILVLIFSLLYKLNCEKSENHPQPQDESDGQVLTDKQAEELSEILKDKPNVELEEGPEDKLNAGHPEGPEDKDAEQQEPPEDKLNSELSEGPGDKQDAELNENTEDKLNVELQEGPEDKQDGELQEGPEDKAVLQEDREGDEIKESESLPAPLDDGEVAELKEIVTDKEEELQEGPAEKQDEELHEAPAEKMDTVEAQEDEGDEEGGEIKNKKKVPTCEQCANDKESGSKGEVANEITENEDENQMKKALNLFPVGDVADLFGNNQHYKIPDNYYDFGRRFVLQYPYTEKKSIDEEAEDDLHNVVKHYIENKQDSHDPLPIKAPPEFVLEIAKRSLLLDQTKPKNPTDDIIHKDILRSGNYWNDVRTEEIDPKKILRSTQLKNNLESVKVEIQPGSKLYDLISMLKEKSPRLLYVINKDFD